MAGKPAGRRGGSGTRAAVAASGVFFAVLVLLVALGHLPVLVPIAVVVLSGLAVLMYRADKSAARENRWRVAESSLHTVALLGGWPGALIARQVYRHKTTKQPFRTIFWLTVLANCAALAALAFAWPISLF